MTSLTQSNFPHLTRLDVAAGLPLLLTALGFAPLWRGLLAFARKHKRKGALLDRELARAFEREMLRIPNTDALIAFAERLFIQQAHAAVEANPEESSQDPRFRRAVLRFQALASHPEQHGFEGRWGRLFLFGDYWYFPIPGTSSGFMAKTGDLMPLAWWAVSLNADWV